MAIGGVPGTRRSAGSTISRLVFHLILVVYVVAPTYWYLRVEETPQGSQPIGYSIVTQTMLAWVAAGLGFLTYWLPQLGSVRQMLLRFTGSNTPNPTMTTEKNQSNHGPDSGRQPPESGGP
jgi:hypothetical protein